VVQNNLETFLAEAEATGRCVPAFVEREFRSFLDCGLPAPPRAHRLLGIADGKTGSVSFLQRSGGAINLNLHYHVLVTDGVYADPEGSKTPTFSPLPPPDDKEIARVTAAIAKRILRLLRRRGLLADDGAPLEDPLHRDEPLLAGCAAASIRQRIATGPRRGQAVMRLGDRIEAEDVESMPGRRCASVEGFSLHAGVAVDALDRQRLERLQPNYDIFGAPTLAFQRDNHARGSSVARRGGGGATEPRLQRDLYRTCQR
jgi:hypothetical protein